MKREKMIGAILRSAFYRKGCGILFTLGFLGMIAGTLVPVLTTARVVMATGLFTIGTAMLLFLPAIYCFERPVLAASDDARPWMFAAFSIVLFCIAGAVFYAGLIVLTDR